MGTIQSVGAIAGAASISNKAVNQDAFEMVNNPTALVCAVAVADGLGSHFGAEVAARLVVSSIGGQLGRLGNPEELDIASLFSGACESIKRYWLEQRGKLPPGVDPLAAFGTTAICCVSLPDRIAMGYVGNGGLFHLRGNFNSFPSSQLMPWSALNYLNPHSIPHQGKNLLYKLLSPVADGATMTPTDLSITKDLATFGDIMICVTDGIYSFDQVQMGYDNDRHIWISGEPSMDLLFKRLDQFFTTDPTSSGLTSSLETYLGELLEAGLVSDDCTVAVLVTDRALEYQAKRNAMATDPGGPR